jgi:hypothetical protein
MTDPKRTLNEDRRGVLGDKSDEEPRYRTFVWAMRLYGMEIAYIFKGLGKTGDQGKILLAVA